MIFFFGLIVCLYSTLYAVKDALDFEERNGPKDILLIVNKTSPFMYLPRSYTDDIATREGMIDLSYVTWVGGYFRNPSWRLPAFAVSENYFSLGDNITITPQEYERWKQDRYGVALNIQYAKKFGIKVGDPFPINETVWNIPQNSLNNLRVRAFVEVEDNDFGVYIHYELIESLRLSGKGLISYIYVKTDEIKSHIEYSKSIDAIFSHNVLDGLTKTALPAFHVKEFSRQFLDLGQMLFWISISISIAFVNIVAMNYYLIAHRSISDYITLNVLGFKRRIIVLLLWMKLSVISLFGGVLGLLFSYLAINLSNVYLQGMIPNISLGKAFYLYSSLVLIIVSVISIIPATFVVFTNKKIER